MKLQIILLLVAVFCSIVVEGTSRRKQRCYYKLCYKCRWYLDTARVRRSLPDEEDEFDSDEDDLVDDLDIERKPNSLHWHEGNSYKMDEILRRDQPDEFDLPSHEETTHKTITEPAVKTAVMSPTKSKGKGKHRKRSTRSRPHVDRCLYILKQRCCRSVFGTFIGKVKKF